MRVTRLILCVACLFWFQATLFASERSKPTNAQRETASEVQVIQSDWKKQPEAIALDEQNKVIKQYHSSLLDTVYFALSLVGAATALLVGASYLINFKLYESDKGRIDEKIVSLANQIEILRKSQLESSLSLRSELDSNITAQVERAKSETNISVQAQLAAYADRSSSEMVGLRNEISSIVERNEKKHETVQAKLEALQTAQNELTKMIAHVEALALEAEAEALDIREYDGAKLITLCSALQAAIRSSKRWRVESILDSIEETLRTFIDSKRTGVSPETLGLVREWAIKTEALAKERSAKVLSLISQIETSRA